MRRKEDGLDKFDKKNTIGLFEGMSFPELKTKLPLKLKNVQKSGNEIILNYKF